MKRVVHFMGRTERDSVLLPEGSSTQDGRAPGVSVELPRFANHREVRLFYVHVEVDQAISRRVC